MNKVRVEEVPIGKLKPAKYNPRRKLKPGDKEYEDIKASLSNFGLVQLVVWNERNGNVVGGHQRLNVIRREQPDALTVTCAVVNLDDKDEKSLNIILNKTGEGLWNQGKLETLINDLAEQNANIHRLGFTEEEIEAMIQTKPEPALDPNTAPKPPAKPKTIKGDVFDFADEAGVLTHRLVCGDATDPDDWNKLLMQKPPAQMVFTDPPYGVSYESQSKNKKMSRKDLQNDNLRDQALQHFIRDVMRNADNHTTPEAAAYIFYASRCHIQFEQGLKDANYEVKQQIIWVKQLALGRADYHWAHEPCLYVQKAERKAHFHGDRAQTTVWEEQSVEELRKALRCENTTVWMEKRDPPSSYIHPTQKPISLAAKALRMSTFYGETVIDPFGGSGSTLIAAETEQRRCLTMELDPAFAEGIVNRYRLTFPDRLVTKNGKELKPEKDLAKPEPV